MKTKSPFAPENSELLTQAFSFWFMDHAHIRSPIPAYIQSDLQALTTKRFTQWLDNLHEKADTEVKDDTVAEKLEELLFDEALKLVQQTDERITILYPFLPRLGDQIVLKQEGEPQEAKIIARALESEKDLGYLKVTVQNLSDQSQFTTRFELPV